MFYSSLTCEQSHLNANQMAENKRLKGDKNSTSLIEYSQDGLPAAFPMGLELLIFFNETVFDVWKFKEMSF